jgi:zinc transport system permease protein
MTNVWVKLAFYFQFPFVRYAMIVGVLIAFCSSLLGVTLVLKRFSFIGDGLSHVAFGAMAVAAAMNLTNSFLLVLPVTVACAVLLLRKGQNTKVKGDAAIAMVSVGTLGIGYLIMNVFSKSSGFSANLSADVCSTLFGSTSILTLTMTEVWVCALLSLVVITVFLLFYHKIFAVTFDEDFLAATGVRAKTYNLILAATIAVVIVLAMNLVGALLISALVIFPALSAMRVFKSFRSVTICSVIVSVVCAALGILISIIAETPVGSTIVAVDIAGFITYTIIGMMARRA